MTNYCIPIKVLLKFVFDGATVFGSIWYATIAYISIQLSLLSPLGFITLFRSDYPPHTPIWRLLILVVISVLRNHIDQFYFNLIILWKFLRQTWWHHDMKWFPNHRPVVGRIRSSTVDWIMLHSMFPPYLCSECPSQDLVGHFKWRYRSINWSCSTKEAWWNVHANGPVSGPISVAHIYGIGIWKVNNASIMFGLYLYLMIFVTKEIKHSGGLLPICLHSSVYSTIYRFIRRKWLYIGRKRLVVHTRQ